ncbi:hypothetical protein GOODEAATRI_020013 [Goodea atripinnis]|uniref:CSD2 domain-containing protein n=1 Tax=Goodea atripinnis TaxID=208336 RepID=A0ABV0NLQ3_9TELE
MSYHQDLQPRYYHVFFQSTRHLFTPADRCIPRIRIETRQASTLAGQRIMVAIDGWPKDSRYPNGHFVRSLGSAGEKDTEEEVLLLEHDVPHQAFSQAVLSFLPKMPWIITPEASLTYAEAQMRIDDANKNDDITKSLRGLNKLAKILKRKRIENGYADIIVHRLLAVAIGADSTYPDLMDKHKQSALCNNLNYRHKMSQYAQRASVAFHTQGPTLKVEQHTFHIFDQVKVTISLDDSNIQHQKIRMALTEPVVRAA